VEIKDENFRVEDIAVNNYNDKLTELRNSSRVFEMYENMTVMKKKQKYKQLWQLLDIQL
jgi:hypothetical protein